MNDRAIQMARQEAGDLIVFCDGAEEGSLPLYARRGRVVARDLLAALAALEAERSARRVLQERCETQQEILGRHAYEACGAATR